MLKKNGTGLPPGSDVNRVKMGDCLKSIKMQILDETSDAILKHILETSGRTKEDLANIDTVVIESQSLITRLAKAGLIEIQEDTVLISEKGRKALECFNKWKRIWETLRGQR